jgi:sugar/nucleoside kinase (ribokinase family)
MTKLKKTAKNKPLCIGTGLVALDVILNGKPSTPARLCVGGSCGNVISILSYLGWDSKPIARLSKNTATKNVLKDFGKINVLTDLVSKEDDGSTPIIIHRILKDKNGNPKHRFEFRIPGTNRWLPSYKPVLSSVVESITKKQKKAHVFYFDRVSRSSIELAKFYKENGSLIIFEPTSYKEDRQFIECIEVADIVKYSADRISNYSYIFPIPIAPLEIETLGSNGLRYRMKSGTSKKWIKISPFNITKIVDTAGAGDWCTAGIINELGQNGAKSFHLANKNNIENALKIGQALGALNCMFLGARGLMYNLNYQKMNEMLSKLILMKDISNISFSSNLQITTIRNLKFDSLLK